ncbi:MAG: P-loop containing nucleoside triphosphate hydrolase protein [Benjaminiella poitrasii]|nr:MAG: P-loop containing nucleoside triphosphate hydrolase protein [Benjaminiella poitrasii]
MKKVYTIGISGPSCSGKTTVARILRQVLKHTVIVYQDDFYKPDSEIPIDEKTQLANWDCPGSVNFDQLAECIHYAREHEGRLPAGHDSKEESNIHDGSSLVNKEILAELKNKILEPLISDDKVFVVVDGFMLYWDERVSQLLDCKIFVTGSYATLKSRREERQGYHTAEGYWVDPPGYFDLIVWPEHVKQSHHNKTMTHLFTIDTDENSIEETTLKVSNYLCKEL